MVEGAVVSEGLRERKKRETMQRIAETGFGLFVKNGYQSTTLDEIAAEAGIARRTFFYYFKSKEEILIAYLDGRGFVKKLRPTLLAQHKDQTPMDAVYNALLELLSSYNTEEGLKVSRIFESCDALKARMLAAYAEMEQSTFEAFCELWPEPSMRVSLRVAAMMSIGALRIAKETWRTESGRRPLTDYLQDAFAAVGPAS